MNTAAGETKGCGGRGGTVVHEGLLPMHEMPLYNERTGSLFDEFLTKIEVQEKTKMLGKNAGEKRLVIDTRR